MRFLKSTRRPNVFSQCKLTGYKLNINTHFGFCDNSILLTVFEYKLLWFWCFLSTICVLFFGGEGGRDGEILFSLQYTCTLHVYTTVLQNLFIKLTQTQKKQWMSSPTWLIVKLDQILKTCPENHRPWCKEPKT